MTVINTTPPRPIVITDTQQSCIVVVDAGDSAALVLPSPAKEGVCQ